MIPHTNLKQKLHEIIYSKLETYTTFHQNNSSDFRVFEILGKNKIFFQL